MPINSLAVRRFAPFALLALMLAGCGGVPGRGQATTPDAGDGRREAADAGRDRRRPGRAARRSSLDAGCGACHTFTPAGTTGKVGPDLDNLAAYAKAANQGR